MEKDRSSRGSQQQFSIYSNKGGIVVKEEVSSEKAFTKAVKDICIDERTQPQMERNVSLNFDHSVVDGVIAMELAREPTPKTLSGPGPITSEKDVSGPIKLKKLGAVDTDSAGVPLKPLDEGAVAQKPKKATLAQDTTTANQANSTTVENVIDNSSDTEVIKLPLVNEDHTTNGSKNDRESTDNDSSTGTGTDTVTGAKPVSPSKEKVQDQVAPSPKSLVSNIAGDSGIFLNAPSVPSTPSSPIPNSGSISNRSDSTSTSNRSFAFPVLSREWTSSPVKMVKTDKSHSRKCRGCSALFCCNS